MFLQKLNKSYSNSLPVYEPLPSDLHAPPDHDTGSFSCTTSPLHSVGAVRIVVQSAEIRKSKGWRRLFRLKPSTWVKLKVLGRTKGGVVGVKSEGKETGKIKTWREERAVGKTDVCPETYTPNFGFKSYYTLLGPYEKNLELEVLAKQSWFWPFQGPRTLGNATFMFPSNIAPSPIVSQDLLMDPPYRDSEGEENGHSAQSVVGTSMSRSASRSRSHEHEKPDQGAELEVSEWAVQAPMFNCDTSKIEGYLLFNVFWYPAVPALFPASGMPMQPQLVEADGDDGGVAGAGIVTFTLHSIDHLEASEKDVVATVSLGWHYPPLHTVGGSNSLDIRDYASRSSASSSTESVVQRRELRRQGLSNDPHPDGEDRVATVNKKFDSTFEFLCLDPSSTNLIIKVYEVYRGKALLGMGRKEKELVGHTSVPLFDLIGGQGSKNVASGELDEQSGPGLCSARFVRDRVLPLLEHPTGKARICTEWRELRIPRLHVPVKATTEDI